MTLREDAQALMLPDAPSWRSVVEGYTDRESYRPGDTVTLHCSSAVPSFTVTVTRVGAARDVALVVEDVRGQLHDVPVDAYSTGCAWPATLEFSVDGWPSGYYEVQFSWPTTPRTGDGGTFACFVVRSADPQPDRLLLVLATTTWQAYNEWGGSGLYRFTPVVSLDRPYDRGFLRKRLDVPLVRVVDLSDPPDPRQTRLREYLTDNGYGLRAANAGWYQWERHFAHWAESNGYPLDYAVSSDLQFTPDVLDHRRTMLSVGHDEYWSTGMRDTVESFVARGGNVAFFSGDVCTSKIRYADDGRSWSSYVMQGDPSLDPAWPDGDFTTFWGDPVLARPETSLTGVSTMFAGYARFGAATPRGGRGFLIQQPDHWVFADTDVMWGDSIGTAGCLAGFELCGCEVELRANRLVPTARHGTPPDTQIVAAAPAHLWRLGESSDLFDEDGAWEDSVKMVARLLYGDNATDLDLERLSNGWACMVVHQPGGTVFTASTTEWACCLEDPVIDQITRNVLNTFLE